MQRSFEIAFLSRSRPGSREVNDLSRLRCHLLVFLIFDLGHSYSRVGQLSWVNKLGETPVDKKFRSEAIA